MSLIPVQTEKFHVPGPLPFAHLFASSTVRDSIHVATTRPRALHVLPHVSLWGPPWDSRGLASGFQSTQALGNTQGRHLARTWG